MTERRGEKLRRGVESKFLHPVAQGVPADPKEARRQDLVALGGLQGLTHQVHRPALEKLPGRLAIGCPRDMVLFLPRDVRGQLARDWIVIRQGG